MNQTLPFEKLATLNHGTFEPLVGDVFVVDGEIKVTLVRVTLHPNLRIREGENRYRKREPFSLLFQGSNLMDSGIHQVQHDTLGNLPLSINPVQLPSHHAGHEQTTVFYESVFA